MSTQNSKLLTRALSRLAAAHSSKLSIIENKDYDAEGLERVINALPDQHYDILINNAGTSNTRTPIAFDDLEAMSEAFWAKIMQTNLIGAFRCARAASPALRSAKGAIVSTASVAGLGVPGSSIAYGASKAGLINLTRSLAHALAPDVRVNAVAPGLVRTPWTDPWPDERKAQTIANCLLDRMVEPEEISATMLFLACNPAITGQTVAVDCGRTS